VKKATSKEFYDLLLMQDEVLHDLTEDLYKGVLTDCTPIIQGEEADRKDPSKSFDDAGLAMVILSAIGLTTMSLILLVLNNSSGLF
ncbi:MAG: hypothetical protein WBH03_21045, partial [Cyclobacteriaceae bacterium]